MTNPTPEGYIEKQHPLNQNVAQWAWWLKDGTYQHSTGQCFAGMVANKTENPIQTFALTFNSKHTLTAARIGSELTNQAVLDFVFHPHESPVRSILKTLDYTLVKDNKRYKGIIIRKPDQPSDSIMAVLFAARHAWERAPVWQKRFNKISKVTSPTTAFHLTHILFDLNSLVYTMDGMFWHGQVIQSDTSLKSFRDSAFKSTSTPFSVTPGYLQVSRLWKTYEEKHIQTFFTPTTHLPRGKYDMTLTPAWKNLDEFLEQLPEAVKKYYAQFNEKETDYAKV